MGVWAEREAIKSRRDTWVEPAGRERSRSEPKRALAASTAARTHPRRPKPPQHYIAGPVSCYIDANPLEAYTGGINMYENAGPTNHAIALLGYGEDEDGVKYWVSKE